MENKFYTPSIEEFSIGFEYEHFKTIYSSKLSTRRNSKTLWLEQCYNTSISLSTITKEIKKNNIRVKYLDSTDIESLGFKKTTTLNFYTLDNRQETYLSFYPEMHRVEIGDNHSSGGFAGTVKNKSELKKLLKMLDI